MSHLATSLDLLSLAKSGDQAALGRLMEQMTPYICRLGRRLVGGRPSEDLVQDGIVGVLKALRRFNAASGASFKTFATYSILGAMKNALAANERYHRNHVALAFEPIQQPLHEAADETPGIPLGCLSHQQRAVIESYFGLHGKPELSAKEIGAALSVTPRRVRQTLEAGLSRLAMVMKPLG